MVFDLIVGALAAAGLIVLVWTIFGRMLLPMPKDSITVFYFDSESSDLEQKIRAFLFLGNLGLAPGKLILADRGMNEEQREAALRFCKQYDRIVYSKETGEEAWLNMNRL